MKRILRRLFGQKLIVVGVEWDKLSFSIEQELEISAPEAEKPEKEKVLKINLKMGRGARAVKQVIIQTAHYQAVYFVTEFKNITYARVWRIS